MLIASLILSGLPNTEPRPVQAPPAPTGADQQAKLEDQARLAEWNAWLAGEQPSPPTFSRPKPPPDPNRTTWRFLLGARLADDDLEPLDELFTAGLEAGLRGSDYFSFDIGMAFSHDEEDVKVLGNDVELVGQAIELYAGPRFSREFSQDVALYFGFGGSLAWVEAEAETLTGSANADDTLFGAYVRAGTGWRVSDSAVLGIDVRHIFSENTELAGDHIEMDSTVVSLSIGTGF